MAPKGEERYKTAGLTEAQFEPGSKGCVLRNLLGIKKKREMDVIEQREQDRAFGKLIRIYDQDYRFTSADVCKIHKIWLGPIYSWAGKYRQVNLTKGEFMFASARQIPKLMDEFENGPLLDFTPCRYESLEETVEALSVVHAEFILIHPFRDGNGRVGRLLAMLMASQNGLPPLNFSMIKGRKRDEYFAAIRAGLDRNYKPMEKIFNAVLKRTLRIS